MKKFLNSILILVLVFAVCGCATNKTRVAEGAGIGGTVGAIAGGIIGFQTGHPFQGAAIGGALGAGAGAAVGAQIKKPAAETSDSATAQPTLQEIVNLSKDGASSDTIIAKIKKADHPKYTLTEDDVNYLTREGVSQRVIETLQGYK